MTYSRQQYLNLQDVFARCKRTENNCIEWQGYKNNTNYGRLRIMGKKTLITRWVATLVYGEPKSGEWCLHSCDNPPCVNPDHLRWGSPQENCADKFQRNRANSHKPKGEKHSQSILTEAQVIAMRERNALGIKQNVLAKEYGISTSHVSLIINKKLWSHI